MKLGLISAILGDLSFEEMIDFLAECGLECVEVACWPKGKAERRYAGVSHIDVDTLDDEKCAHILDYCQKKGVEISSLAYYPNTMDPDVEKRTAYIEHLHKLIDASAKLGVNMITTFIGRDPKKTVSQNLELVKEIWPPILDHAKEKGVKVAIENCPMLFTEDEWQLRQSGDRYLKSWIMTTLALTMIRLILSGSRLITFVRCMSLRIKFSMCITKISKSIRRNWQMLELWQRLCSICLRRFLVLEMLTGANMYLP